MARKQISADVLIGLAIEALKRDLGPHLPPERRYTAAMAVRALEIAQREVTTDTEAPEWALLDQIYDDGEGSPADLARDIRNGSISAETRPTLHQDLRRMVAAELAIRNPGHIAGHAKPADDAG